MIELRPITRDEAFAYVREHHRHHGVPVGDIWRHAIQDDDGVLCGVAVVGRPVARELDDYYTCELTRMATDTTPNACSMLYGAWRKAALAKGYRRGLTYILASEDGGSLRAAGLHYLWTVKGRSWDTPSRPRTDKHPTEDKHAYGFGAWKQLLALEKIRAAWSRESSYWPETWSRQTASHGQCAVTSLAVQTIFGGEIVRGFVGDLSHYWNRPHPGVDIDLTLGQFDKDAEREEVGLQTRKALLDDPATAARFQRLLAAIEAA